MNLFELDREKIVEWAKNHPEIKAVYLYGSRARGDNKPDSDVDLAIIMNPQKGDENTFATWTFWHESFTQNPDLILSSEVHLEWYDNSVVLDRVGPGVKRDGILLYHA